MNDSSLINCLLTPLVTPSPVTLFIRRYIFFGQLVFGSIGNVLILAILNTKSFRSKTNVLLSCMTAMDILFLFFRIPLSLATFEYFALRRRFRTFFFLTKMPFLALANWFSAASIWFALAVSIERTFAVRNPLRISPISGNLRSIVLTILSFTYFLTFYFNFWFTPVKRNDCLNGTQGNAWRFHRMTDSSNVTATFRFYLTISPILGLVLIVFVPLTLLIFLNSALILHLRRHRKSLLALGSRINRSLSDSSGGSDELTRGQEARITKVVCVIVGAFILCNLPSVVLHLLSYWHKELARYKEHRICVEISNSLIVTSKVINFLLYCVSSRHFRKKAYVMLKNRCGAEPTARVGRVKSPDRVLFSLPKQSFENEEAKALILYNRKTS